jgi:hypothetical protein
MDCATACATATSSVSGLKTNVEMGGAPLIHWEYWVLRLKPTSDIIYLLNEVRYFVGQ